MPSTSIRKSKYDPESEVLSVWFVASDKRYDYEGVTAQVYAEFRNAFAKGRFFNDRIRNRFLYRLISDD
ncbi:KTSC domain-containing protein [Mesorhizobium sp. 43Arga]